METTRPLSACPRCGAAVIDRGLHGQWHTELDRQGGDRAPMDAAERVLAER